MKYGYNTLTLGNMVRVPGFQGAVRVPGLAGYRGMARFADVPIIVKLPEAETKADAPTSTNWSPIVDALKAFTVGSAKQPTAVQPQGMPQWVWVAAPLVAGIAFVAIVARRK